VFHGAGSRGRGRAPELRPSRLDQLAGTTADTAVDPKIVASAAQAEVLLAAVARIRPALAAFFGCLYYAALRPEEAIALRLVLVDHAVGVAHLIVREA
jgi:integrase